MSLSTIIEVMDTPMVDFNEDSDIPMGGNENWFLPVSRMDEDGLAIHENYSHTESLEVDMVEYEEMAEYEMDEEGIEQTEQNLVDTEVIDVSFHSSPIPPIPQELSQTQHQAVAATEIPVETLQPQLDVDHIEQTPLTQEVVESARITEIVTSSDSAILHETVSVPSRDQIHTFQTIESTYREGLPSEMTASLPENITAESGAGAPDDSHPIHISTSEGSQSTTLNEPTVPSEGDDVTQHGTSTGYEAHSSLDATAVEHAELVHDIPTSTDAKSNHELSADADTSIPSQSAKQTTQNNESHEESHDAEAAEAADPDYHELPEEEQLDSPPIHLKLNVRSSEGDQPDFALFKTPDVLHEGDHPPEEPLVLLQHHQALFYEPISAIFDAFRNEEYFNHLEELSDAEMSLNAPDLQLLISEDNIYAREVSLHDLVAMHQGLGLPGHLRLTLQSVVPRFITRYNQLREQVTRLTIGEAIIVGHDEQVGSHQEDSGVSHEPSSLQDETKEQLPASGASSLGVSDQDGSEHQAGELIVPTKEITTQGAAEEIEDGVVSNEAAYGQSEDATEHAGIKDHDTAPYETEVADDDAEEKEEDFRDELDADRIHDGNDEVREEDREEEHATEFYDETAPEEDDEEGYDEEFGENGNEGVCTVADNFDGAIPEADSVETTSIEDDGDEDVRVRPSVVQAESLSHSTSVVSHDTEETNTSNEELVVNGVDGHPEYIDGPSEVNELANEGNLTEENDDIGDEDFGEEEFDEEDAVTEDTLEESPDENAGQFDAASQAVLTESETFVTESDENADNEGVFKDNDTDVLLRSGEDLVRTPSIKRVITEVDEYVVVHKNASKRSLDEADLEEEDLPSPLSSPGSKRTRVL